MLGKTLLPCLLLAATAAPTLAQEFVLEPGSIEIGELIDRAAQHLGWNILVNEQEISSTAMGGARIKLQNRVAVDAEGCEDMLTTMLDSKGFALCTLDPEKNLYEVISRNGPRMREIADSAVQKTPEQVLARPSLRVPVITVVQLQHVNAVVATNALRPFFASTGGPSSGITLGNVGNNTSLLVSGMQDQVASAIRMIRQCDTPPPEPRPDAVDRLAELEKRIAALEQAIAELKKEK